MKDIEYLSTIEDLLKEQTRLYEELSKVSKKLRELGYNEYLDTNWEKLK